MLSVLEYEGILVVSVSANGEPSNVRSERTKLLAQEICCLPRQQSSGVSRHANHVTIPADILKDTRASSWKPPNSIVTA
jgi:hypothetical protein